MTMPAMAPPDRVLPLAAAGVEVEEGEDVGEAVIVDREMDAVIVGRTTPAHLVSALEL
jgi:hypothetical protein